MLPENIFAQTSLRTLNLNANQFISLSPLRSWFASTASLLEVLTFMTNSLDYLPGEAFEGFTSIKQLNLDNNPLLGLDFNVFYPLEDLRILSLSRCNLTTLRSDLFINLYQLTEMNLALNGFSELPDGVFNSLYRLTELILSDNRLTRVSSLAFGEATTALEVLNISDNGMEAFDEIIFDSSENLRWLFLAGNECISQSFTNVRTQRETVRASLENCFNNY
jgi:Leucine-rich repeat (LRR) protein